MAAEGPASMRMVLPPSRTSAASPWPTSRKRISSCWAAIGRAVNATAKARHKSAIRFMIDQSYAVSSSLIATAASVRLLTTVCSPTGEAFPVPSLAESQQYPFMLQQPPLLLEPTGKAGELALGTDDPVTRDDDRDRVLVAGEADGTTVPITQLASELAVRCGRAVRDGAQRVPHAVLERRAERFERQVERRARAREVLAQLGAGAREQFGFRSLAIHFHPARLMRRGGPAT